MPVFQRPKGYDPNKAQEERLKKEQMAQSLGLDLGVLDNVADADIVDQDDNAMVDDDDDTGDSISVSTTTSTTIGTVDAETFNHLMAQVKRAEQQCITAEQEVRAASDQARKSQRTADLESRKNAVLKKSIEKLKQDKSALELELNRFKTSAGLLSEEEKQRITEELQQLTNAAASQSNEVDIEILREEIEHHKKVAEEAMQELQRQNSKQIEMQQIIDRLQSQDRKLISARGKGTGSSSTGRRAHAAPLSARDSRAANIDIQHVKRLQDELAEHKKLLQQRDREMKQLRQDSDRSMQTQLLQVEREATKLQRELQQQKSHFEQLLQEELKKERARAQEISNLASQQSQQHVHTMIRQLSTKIKSMQQQQLKWKNEVSQLLDTVVGEEMQRLKADAISPMFHSLQDTTKRYYKEVKQRRDLFNQLQELKGNIRVYVRVRPPMEKEAKEECAIRAIPQENELTILDRSHSKTLRFDFERVFGPETTQAHIFEDIQPLATSILDGYNVCIFAYGQTGSGKTHTMEGPVHDRGVNYRTLNELFRIGTERAEEYEYQFRVSVLEIYNENIVDLLDNSRPSLTVQLSGKHVVVPNLTMMHAQSSNDVIQILNRGYKNRAVASNNYNEHSSRSHCIVSVHCETVNRITQKRYSSKLHLVDLAGSERLKKTETMGDRLKESMAINKSLSALGDVIAALAQKSRHIPFRNSKLTSLLQDSLGGNSKCLMFVNVSPTLENAGESISSLQFASRVRAVELGKTERNVVRD